MLRSCDRSQKFLFSLVVRVGVTFAVALASIVPAYATQPVILKTLTPYLDSGIPRTAIVPPEKNDGDEPTLFSCYTDLATTGTAFLGCEMSLEMPGNFRPDTLLFEAKKAGTNSFLEVQALDVSGKWYRSGVQLPAKGWQSCELPLRKFIPVISDTVEGDPTQPLHLLTRLRFLMRDAAGTSRGFSIRKVTLDQRCPPVRLLCSSQTTVPIQRDGFFLVRVESKANASYPTRLICATSAPNELIVPESVPVQNGFAKIPLFIRSTGPHVLHVYEPDSGSETSATIYGRPAGLVVRLVAEEFEKQQSLIAPCYLKPRATFEGGTSIPQAVLISAYDTKGRCVLSQLVSSAALSAGQAQVLIPLPGLLEMRAKVYAEPLASQANVPSIFPLNVGSRPQDARTTVAISLPDHVTTAVVGGFIIAREDVPSTATLLGEDRFVLWAFAKVPSEVRLPTTLFGIEQREVSQMDIVKLGQLGKKLFAWQARIGPIWVRVPYFLQDMIASPEAYSWPRVQTLAKYLKDLALRVDVSLPVPSADDLVRSFASPGDKQTTLARWLRWMKYYRTAAQEKIRVFDIRTPLTAVAPTSSYPPEVLWSAMRSARQALMREESTPSLVFAMQADYNPVEFEAHVQRALRDWTEAEIVAPYLPLPWESPDRNALEQQIASMRNVLRKHNLLRRPLWVGPVGWSSHPGASSEFLQANYLTRAYTIAASSGAIRLFWNVLRDRCDLPWEGTFYDHCGLLDSQFRPKPAAIACNLALFMLTQTKALDRVRQGSATVYSFAIELHSTRWPGKLYVAWTDDEAHAETVKLPISPAGAYAFDYLGAQVDPVTIEPLQSTGTSVDDKNTTRVYSYRVTHEPLYVWDVTTIPPSPTRHEHIHDLGKEKSQRSHLATEGK